MTKANLFIVGAPKCGTTSLANYLDQHPDIYLSRPKEPHYFNFGMNNRYVKTVEDYNGLFLNRSDKYLMDASVWYYYSDVAIIEILKYNPEAKFIYMVRDPVSLFYSLHQELLNTFEENEKDTRKAWHLSFEREKGEKLPALTKEKSLLFYHRTCLLGSRLAYIKSLIKPTALMIVDFNAFTNQTKTTFHSILEKLDLPKVDLEFITYNARKAPRNAVITKFIKLAGTVKNQLGITKGFNVLNSLKRSNLQSANKKERDTELDIELQKYFRADVEKLSVLSGIDFLKNWGY